MIHVFGDSFSIDNSNDSWITRLNATSYSTCGASEYRIWKTYQLNKHLIAPTDIILFCHTSPYRIFLKDNSTLLSRLLPSHPFCDIIINDIISKKESKFISVLNTIWDDEYFNDTHVLLVNDLKKTPNSFHFTFFESDIVHSFYETWVTNTGKINHLTINGNDIVYRDISKWLD
jgi:hypothetical protein